MNNEKASVDIKFGTDGWRGVISDNFTFQNVAIVAQAISEWLRHDIRLRAGQTRKVAIGYDTRFLSEEYARTVSCVLAKNNIEVYLSNSAIPTPALSYGVTRIGGLAGIMITASHNPGKFNGIKIKTAQGGGASKNITDKVEDYLCESEVETMDFDLAVKEKRVILHDFKLEYIDFIRKYIDFKSIKPTKFKVVVDAMHGSGNRLIEKILAGTRVKLDFIRDDINPSFDGGKPEPVIEYLGSVLHRVKAEKFDLGLVLDGDADRIAGVASGGEFIHPQKILGLLILHLVRNRGRKGGIVKTICGTTMLDHIARKLGLKIFETPVGFKYISDIMVSERIIAGGEEAGGIGLQDYIPERDGTLAGLLLLEMMVYEKKNIKKIIAAMEKEFGRYYYERSDLKLKKMTYNEDKIKSIKRLLGRKVITVKDFDGVKLICEDESWLMFRPSGTEPLVRIYSESKSLTRARQLIKLGEKFLKQGR